MPQDKIEKIEQVGGGRDDAPVVDKPEVAAPERVAPNNDHFNSLMHQDKAATARPVAPANDPTKMSLMDNVRDLNQPNSARQQATMTSLVSQTQEAITQIDKIKKTLEGPNVNIKHTAQQLLHNKLSHIDESLKIALSKAGVEYDPAAVGANAVQPSASANPIERFLGFLTDGQWKLEKLGHDLTTMSNTNKELTPVNMLAIQVKVGQIQQELELFSSLLNKALESIKTIMNIQV
ncbi:MAG: hypothetical protein H0X51_05315 [Parachlamydiaceae bacterium]|nr:hypothetical protein [Parachlamydiaceae bacterium]